MFKPAHLAAAGLLLTSLAAQIATLPQWADATKPAFVAAFLTAIGSTAVALFSDKPRSEEARTRSYDDK
jgi:hypothetical protein